MSLDLFNQDAAKAIWINQISFIFSRCKAEYKNENEGEIEISFDYIDDETISIFVRDHNSKDVEKICISVLYDLHEFINNFTDNIKVVDFCPELGLTSIVLKRKFKNCEIIVFSTDDHDIHQLKKNFRLNNIEDIEIYKIQNRTDIQISNISYELGNIDLFKPFDAKNNNYNAALIYQILLNSSYLMCDVFFIDILQAKQILYNHHAWKELALCVKMIVIYTHNSPSQKLIDNISLKISLLNYKLHVEKNIITIIT